jgi:hypothetical protein
MLQGNQEHMMDDFKLELATALLGLALILLGGLL